MNRIPNLLDFSIKTGILNISNKTVQYGLYGQLILNQIKNEWLRANLTKFETSFRVDSINFLNNQSNNENFSFKDYTKNLANIFEINNPPFSILNVFTSDTKCNRIEHAWDRFDQEKHFYSDCKPASLFTHLNGFHFCNDEHLNPNDFTDSLSFWQRERKNWWIKLFNCPENVYMNNQSIDDLKIGITDLFYNKNSTAKWLENISCIDNLTEHEINLESILKSIKEENNSYLANTKQLIITQTTCENVLESILNDSVQYRRKKSDILKLCKFENEKDKLVFRLDYRLAPYKACILYEKTNSDSIEIKKCYQVAEDMRKLFVYNQINVLLLSFDSKKETIENKYDKLDELGVPYTIFIKASRILKDGICLIRNRDTTLEEHLHISKVVEQFNSISNALNF
jgi:hypothetical protein